MRRAALPIRLDRLSEQRHVADRERTVREVAAEYGLSPAEVRAELAHVTEEARRVGPCTAVQAVQRCAEKFGLPEEELWDEYARITGTAGGAR